VLNIVQSHDTSQGVPIFRAPVIVGVVSEGGSTSARIFLRKKEESVELPCALRPLMVRFDQGNHLLKELTFQKTTDELLYQATHDDVIGRMWAIGELATSLGEVRVRSGLMDIAREDSFWAVRRDAVYRLGGFRGTVQMDLDRGLIPQARLDSVQLPEGLDVSAMTAFFESMALDVNSQVRAAALYGLGNLGRKEESAFLMDRFSKEESYVAQASALRALGKCGDRSVSDFLRRASAMESPRNVLRTAAEWALKRLGP
jgi:aminopeptidase N